jgi:hypothetical protein
MEGDRSGASRRKPVGDAGPSLAPSPPQSAGPETVTHRSSHRRLRHRRTSRSVNYIAMPTTVR